MTKIALFLFLGNELAFIVLLPLFFMLLDAQLTLVKMKQLFDML